VGTLDPEFSDLLSKIRRDFDSASVVSRMRTSFALRTNSRSKLAAECQQSQELPPMALRQF
jgi:hypothetical protein